ncbi:MAG TPA: GNAT family N-acetyltransferase [Kofleriaceae bacterium]|jgi:ribosomal protein S18 acetylase RimI-like enzyme|nr:GNAT family N-acetyltransferase [Kofleriaceae bacterium]
MQIEIATHATDELVGAFARLLPQLSATSRATAESIARAIDSEDVTIFVARHDHEIIGLATLIAVPIPTKIRAIIEDVVVDTRVRGQGAGEALVRAMIDHARATGATAIELTSHPDRAAANRLYQRLGFALRTTNPYRLVL